MASKVRFFFFLASKRVGEEGGRRGASEAWMDQSLGMMIVLCDIHTSRVAMGLLVILVGWKRREAV